jgi:hypothetical protein
MSHNSVNSGVKTKSVRILFGFHNTLATRELQRIWVFGDSDDADSDKRSWTGDYQPLLFWLPPRALTKRWHRFDNVKHCETTVEPGVCRSQRGRPPLPPPPAGPKDVGLPRERELCARRSGLSGSHDVAIPTRRGTTIRGQEHCNRPTADLVFSLLPNIWQGSVLAKNGVFPISAGASLPKPHLFIFSRADVNIILSRIVPFKFWIGPIRTKYFGRDFPLSYELRHKAFHSISHIHVN